MKHKKEGDYLKIGIIVYKQKVPNVAMMKVSKYFKEQGAEVYLNTNLKTLHEDIPNDVDLIYCSVLFTWHKEEASKLRFFFGDKIIFGGTGWDNKINLPKEIEQCKPDYDLYRF